MSRLSDEQPRPATEPGRPLLDRSRGRMRMPVDLLPDVLRIAQVQAVPEVNLTAMADPIGTETLERLAPIMVGEDLAPMAFELAQVVNQASLIVAVDLSYGTDTSVPTIWATPRRAVLSDPIDPSLAELEPVPIKQLPQVLAQIVVLRSPTFVAPTPLTVDAGTLSEALGKSSREAAIEVLATDDLSADEAVLLLDLQLPDVRRWRINSSWSTESGPTTESIQGLDAGANGQWLESSVDGRRVFNPLGHGEAISALREVLPRNWMGTPLKTPTI